MFKISSQTSFKYDLFDLWDTRTPSGQKTQLQSKNVYIEHRK